MRSSIWTWILTTSIFAAAVGLSACGQKKDDTTAAVDGRVRTAGAATTPTNPQGYISGRGAYVTSSSVVQGGGSFSASQFQRNVSDFVASTWDPSGLGEVNDQSFQIQGYFEMGAAGQFNLAASTLKIWIYDSYAKDNTRIDSSGKTAQPYYVQYGQAASGSISGNQFTIVFKDDYQEVTLTGTYNGDSTTGNLSFKNLKDAAGGQLKSASPMGYYNIMTCALLNCKKQ